MLDLFKYSILTGLGENKDRKNEKPFPAFCRDSQIPIIFCNWSTTGGMRWPNVNIQWNNIYLTGFKQKNAKSLIISVLIFRCPGRTHITNLTRMPQEMIVEHPLYLIIGHREMKYLTIVWR